MGDLDFAAKVVLREDPGALLSLACPGLNLTPVRMAPTERVRVHQFMDSLVEVDVPGVGRGFVHFEFAASWKSDVPDREFDYYALARSGHRPLLPVVVCMKPDDRQATPRDVITITDRFGPHEVMRFQFQAVRLWELPAITFLATPSLAALAPFAAGASEATVEEAMRVLDGVEPEARGIELKVALAMFAGSVFPARDWSGTIPEEILMTSITYQRLRLKIVRDALAGLLQARLGVDAEPLIARLAGASEDAIDEGMRLLATLRSDKELVAALDALLPR